MKLPSVIIYRPGMVIDTTRNKVIDSKSKLIQDCLQFAKKMQWHEKGRCIANKCQLNFGTRACREWRQCVVRLNDVIQQIEGDYRDVLVSAMSVKKSSTLANTN